MPETIFLFIASAVNAAAASAAGAGAGAFTLFGFGLTIGDIVATGLLVGGSLAASTMMQQQVRAPKPQDVQQSFRQATAPRLRHYGRVKVSGPWVVAETIAGNFHKVIALGQGKMVEVESLWIDDKDVEVDGSGNVTTEPYVGAVTILTRQGLSTETSYSTLTSVLPEWTSAHRGDGVASLYAVQKAVTQETYLERFSNGINTTYRVVAKFTEVWNPVTEVTEWSDNAAAIIRDFVVHQDGLRLPAAAVTTTLAQAGWETAFNVCDDDIDLDAGGTEKRYRLWGSYRFDERPADVLGRMLACCDGRLVLTRDGGMTLEVGAFSEPSVAITDDMIVAFSDVGRGRDILSTANTIKAQYTAEDHDFQLADADPWVDEADVTSRGEIPLDVSFPMAPSHTQARRLMKLAYYNANPTWVGTFVCTLAAMAAFQERFVRLIYTPFGIDEVVTITNFAFNVGDGGILRTVTITVQSMPQEAYEWDEATEEGVAPVAEASSVDNTIPAPTGFNASIETKVVGGIEVPFALLTFDAPPAASLTIEAQGRLTTATDWTSISVIAGATSAESFVLEEDADYEFRVRHVTLSGRKGDWSDVVTILSTIDDTPPSAITDAAASPQDGSVSLTWTAPSSANYSRTIIKRNTSNTEGGATEITAVYGDPSSSGSYSDTSVTNGTTYYYWLYATNVFGISAAGDATGAVTPASEGGGG